MCDLMIFKQFGFFCAAFPVRDLLMKIENSFDKLVVFLRLQPAVWDPHTSRKKDSPQNRVLYMVLKLQW